VQVHLASHTIAGTIIGESGDINLSDAPDPELEGIPLPHAVNMFPLKPFAGGLWFWFDPDEKPVFLEDPMDCSPGTRQVELVLDPTGSPCRIFPFKPDDPLFQ
jgi:hypothetical protein